MHPASPAGRRCLRLRLTYAEEGRTAATGGATDEVWESGLALQTRFPAGVGTALRGEITLPSGLRVPFRGIVRWSFRPNGLISSSFLGQMAIELLDPDPAYLRFLAEPEKPAASPADAPTAPQHERPQPAATPHPGSGTPRARARTLLRRGTTYSAQLDARYEDLTGPVAERQHLCETRQLGARGCVLALRWPDRGGIPGCRVFVHLKLPSSERVRLLGIIVGTQPVRVGERGAALERGTVTVSFDPSSPLPPAYAAYLAALETEEAARERGQRATDNDEFDAPITAVGPPPAPMGPPRSTPPTRLGKTMVGVPALSPPPGPPPAAAAPRAGNPASMITARRSDRASA